VPQKIPNGRKIFQMIIKLPTVGVKVWKYTIWQTCSTYISLPLHIIYLATSLFALCICILEYSTITTSSTYILDSLLTVTYMYIHNSLFKKPLLFKSSSSVLDSSSCHSTAPFSVGCSPQRAMTRARCSKTGLSDFDAIRNCCASFFLSSLLFMVCLHKHQITQCTMLSFKWTCIVHD
jgi:hypothetical protein